MPNNKTPPMTPVVDKNDTPDEKEDISSRKVAKRRKRQELEEQLTPSDSSDDDGGPRRTLPTKKPRTKKQSLHHKNAFPSKIVFVISVHSNNRWLSKSTNLMPLSYIFLNSYPSQPCQLCRKQSNQWLQRMENQKSLKNWLLKMTLVAYVLQCGITSLHAQSLHQKNAFVSNIPFVISVHSNDRWL